MQTHFTPAQLTDPDVATSESVIRKCVHCGFCTATCPTYVLLGDELDSPRGRIYLIKEMLEKEQAPSAETVKHIDRCLSCLSCMTTCPSSVNYMHLVDHARSYVEQNYRRPLPDRLVRALLARVLPYPARFRAALRLARLARPFAALFPAPISAMLRLAPARVGTPSALPTSAAGGERIVLLQGCAEAVLRPEIRAATLRLLGRIGYDVIFAKGENCCGALVHHLGRTDNSLEAVRRNVDAWTAEIDNGGLRAIVTSVSGCGSMLKEYGFLLRNDPEYAQKAARVSALVRDISELLAESTLPALVGEIALDVAYHPPCSLQHGQKVREVPEQLLTACGFTVRRPANAHLCCGSAGTYNILQAEIAGKLGERKAASLAELRPDVIATGNIGCAMQIAAHGKVPVVHTVELIDWATGGIMPDGLKEFSTARRLQ